MQGLDSDSNHTSEKFKGDQTVPNILINIYAHIFHQQLTALGIL